MNKIKKEIKTFLKNKNQKELKIEYKGKKLNAACDWSKLKNPLGMLIRGILNEIFKKLLLVNLKTRYID